MLTQGGVTVITTVPASVKTKLPPDRTIVSWLVSPAAALYSTRVEVILRVDAEATPGAAAMTAASASRGSRVLDIHRLVPTVRKNKVYHGPGVKIRNFSSDQEERAGRPAEPRARGRRIH